MAFALTSSLSKIPIQRSKGVIIQVQGLYISTKKRIEEVYKQIFAAGSKAYQMPSSTSFAWFAYCRSHCRRI